MCAGDPSPDETIFPACDRDGRAPTSIAASGARASCPQEWDQRPIIPMRRQANGRSGRSDRGRHAVIGGLGGLAVDADGMAPGAEGNRSADEGEKSDGRQNDIHGRKVHPALLVPAGHAGTGFANTARPGDVRFFSHLRKTL
jgi:hypothetical protein